MKVLLNEKNVVVAKSKDIKEVSNGFFIPEQNTVYAPHGLKLVETKLDPRIQQDKLVNGKIQSNPDYKTLEQIKAESEARQKEMEKKLL
jgi:hypothetical protein